MRFSIAVLPGDGVGPEVTREAVRALEAVGRHFGHTFEWTEDLVGFVALQQYDIALRPEMLEQCRKMDAILFGAVGNPTGDDGRIIREALFPLRRTLQLFANVRPVRAYPALADSTAIKASVIHGADVVVVRELTGGLYFGKPSKRWTSGQGRQGVDTLRYSEREVRRILQVGFDLARQRQGRLTSVDKANVLETSRMWREIANEMVQDYPDVRLDHMYVDACAMQLMSRPRDFDVVVTENMFGDILSDEASILSGSLGLLPSASLGTRRVRKAGVGLFGMYEPIHGTAPDIAGQGMANPIGAILSAALLLRYSLGLEEEAGAVERAVERALADGLRTPDLVGEGDRPVGTTEMGAAIVDRLK